MLIISKYHDYYDHVQQAGVDKRVVLLREMKEIDVPNGLKFSNMQLASIDERGNRVASYNFISGRVFRLEWLFFCGKAYPKIFSFDKEYNSDVFHNIKFYSTLEEAEQDIPPSAHYFNSKNWNTGMILAHQVREILSMPREIDANVFQKLKAPYFVYKRRDSSVRYGDKGKVITFPVLKDYTPFLNLDAYSTYQEIEMYCSGVMGVGEPEIIEVSDISKRDSKGFDKFSFKHRK